MVLSSLGSSQSIAIERNKIIVITKRTVCFSRSIYQIHNIAEIGEGNVDVFTIPWGILVAILILGLIIQPFNFVLIPGLYHPFNSMGSMLISSGIAGGFWNIAKPKQYGLLLTLNSGDKKLFVTSDKAGLKRVIAAIYDFIESQKDVTYLMTINNSRVDGNFIQGNVGRSALFNSNK